MSSVCATSSVTMMALVRIGTSSLPTPPCQRAGRTSAGMARSRILVLDVCLRRDCVVVLFCSLGFFFFLYIYIPSRKVFFLKRLVYLWTGFAADKLMSLTGNKAKEYIFISLDQTTKQIGSLKPSWICRTPARYRKRTLRINRKRSQRTTLIPSIHIQTYKHLHNN